MSDREPCLNVVEFSVVIVATSHNPTILNADFLRHNGIVGERWQPGEDRLTSPMLSRVPFNGGLVVQADPMRVKFEQSGDALDAASLVCASAAKGYLRTVPHVPYIAIGMNVKCVLRNLPLHRVSEVLKSCEDWTTFQSVVPKFEIKATYEMTAKSITLDVQELVEGADLSAVCRANVHRQVEEENQQMRLNFMLSALDAWETDLADVRALAQQYAPFGLA